MSRQKKADENVPASRRRVLFLAHQVAEYVVALALIVVGFHSSGGAEISLVTSGFLLAAVNLITSGPLGVFGVLSRGAHHVGDLVIAGALIVLPIVFVVTSPRRGHRGQRGCRRPHRLDGALDELRRHAAVSSAAWRGRGREPVAIRARAASGSGDRGAAPRGGKGGEGRRPPDRPCRRGHPPGRARAPRRNERPEELRVARPKRCHDDVAFLRLASKFACSLVSGRALRSAAETKSAAPF